MYKKPMTMKFLKKQPRGLCQPWGGHALGKAVLGWVGSIPDARGEPGAGQGVGVGTVVVKVRALCGLDL